MTIKPDDIREITRKLHDARIALDALMDGPAVPEKWQFAAPLTGLSYACRTLADTCRTGERWTIDKLLPTARDMPNDGPIAYDPREL